ncbi:CENPC protein, partial [Turnix velox]|nr:CENPC protein [Turnix velox]
IGKTKKAALRGSPRQKKNMAQKPGAEKPEDKQLRMLSSSGLETKSSDLEQCKTYDVISEDLPVTPAEHQQEETESPRENPNSSEQSASEVSQHLVNKKIPSKQEIPKPPSSKRLPESLKKQHKKPDKKSHNKKPQLQREKAAPDDEPGQEEIESEPVKLNEVLALPMDQKSQTPRTQKLPASGKPKNALESVDGTNYETAVKMLQHFMDMVKNSERKCLPARSSGKTPKKTCPKTGEGVCSSPKDTEGRADSDSSSVEDMARKKQKLADVKRKRNVRKCNLQHRLHGPVLDHCDRFASSGEYHKQDSTSSDSSQDSICRERPVPSDYMEKHKIVMPSNTPNVRRTKRIRLRPLEYWRGEHVNYKVDCTGELVISGVVCPEGKNPSKNKARKGSHKQKKTEKGSEIPKNLSLSDPSKPTLVVDPETNKEVFLECVNNASNLPCFYKSEKVEIYKYLNTPAFAIGKLILKPLQEKGRQHVFMDTVAFHVIYGKIIVTLHKSSYCLTTGHYFYIPAGNEYNICNLLNEESILLFTQFKN